MCRPWKFAETSSWSKTSSKSEAGAVALLCVRLKVGPRRCIAAAMKGRREVYKGRKNVSGGGRGGGGGGECLPYSHEYRKCRGSSRWRTARNGGSEITTTRVLQGTLSGGERKREEEGEQLG
mmetsp:Transcript_66157/g.138190  ORF Transcript_66157/g.138190 Transcript_66157/m.138190 type:complete len:122 (+) Transcript_66157:1723-2088(+)